MYRTSVGGLGVGAGGTLAATGFGTATLVAVAAVLLLVGALMVRQATVIRPHVAQASIPGPT